MANNRILNKRGLIANIETAVLKAGEFALAFNAENTKVQLWVGISSNSAGGTEKLLVNPDVIVPANVSDLANDSGFQTAAQVAEAIATAIAGKGTASFTKANTVPNAADAVENVLYLVMNEDTEHYDIYAKIDGEMEIIDDTTVDLSGYVTSAALTTILADYVQKDGDKVLSDNNYTDEEKTKLAGIAAGAQVNTLTGVKGENENDYRTGNVNITKANIGLGNIDNTSDADKPISTATQTALDGKMDADADIDCGTF